MVSFAEKWRIEKVALAKGICGIGVGEYALLVVAKSCKLANISHCPQN